MLVDECFPLHLLGVVPLVLRQAIREVAELFWGLCFEMGIAEFVVALLSVSDEGALGILARHLKSLMRGEAPCPFVRLILSPQAACRLPKFLVRAVRHGVWSPKFLVSSGVPWRWIA